MNSIAQYELTNQLKYGIKLIIVIIANLASVELISASSSSDEETLVSENSKEFNIHAPIAIAKGASCCNSALHIPLFLSCNSFFFCFCKNSQKLRLNW